VWLVVLAHWTLPGFPVGEMGRIPFFVLSGYLISGIVWKQQVYPSAPGRWARRLGVFYQRRMLRILPPYYLALALGALLPLATLREFPGWFVLPVSNLLFYRLGHWGEGVATTGPWPLMSSFICCGRCCWACWAAAWPRCWR
jgi:peptidoglycan/LPS O-acetylase OafA/YrhL